MTTLAEFIKARLDEDEATAQAAIAETPACRRCEGRATGQWSISAEHNPVIKDAGAAQCSQVVVYNDGSPLVNEHIARNDPARVLREVAATRRALSRHRPTERRDGWHPTCWFDNHRWPCAAVLDMAAIWSDHPDYDPAWSPQPEHSGT